MSTGAFHPFRFAVQAYDASSASEWRALARQAEDLGYSTLHLADHYIGPGVALTPTNHPVQTIAAVPAMAMAAEATTTLRLGCRVFCVDYHHPVVLAKELATMDLLSDGRIEAGLGAGWLAGEYGAMGIPFHGAGDRIERLGTVVDLLRDAFAGAEIKVDHAGVFAQGFEAVPRPAQPGGPPIIIGGGSPKVLRLAGAKADIVSLNFNNASGRIGPSGVGSSTAEETRAKVGWVRQGAGDRFADLELEIGAYFVTVTDRPVDVLARLSATFDLPPDELLRHPHVLVGSVTAITEQLIRRRDQLGISYVTIPAPAMTDFAPVAQALAGH